MTKKASAEIKPVADGFEPAIPDGEDAGFEPAIPDGEDAGFETPTDLIMHGAHGQIVSKPKFIRRHAVIRPVLKLEQDIPVFFKVEAPIFLGEKVDPKKDPAHLMHVINLETGEQSMVVVTKLLGDALHKNYPDDSYVGHAFECCVQAMKRGAGGNNFRPVELYEIDA